MVALSFFAAGDPRGGEGDEVIELEVGAGTARFGADASKCQ